MSRIRKIGVIMNGVTGRMGTNQHLLRSILPIIEQGGITLSNGDRIIPDPVLVGRSEDKLRALSSRSGVENFTTDLDSALKDEKYSIYFDAQTTERRAPSVLRALEYGKHIYCEKPSALDSAKALNLYRAAENAGVVHGIVQDKLWLPGLVKLKTVRDSGFFGKILSVRGEFGYWVFEGDTIKAQRPSWNYRKEDGGGIIAQFNSSWAVRVRRDDLLTIQVDGTKGSAAATLRKCFIQPYNATPMNVWNPDIDSPVNHFDGWQEVPDTQKYENAFKVQWELFLRAAAEKRPFEWGLMAGVEGIQLAEKGIESWQKRQWVDIPDILI